VGHSAAVLTGLEHNHKRWLPVTRAFVLPTYCNDRFRSCALAWSTTVDGVCGSMFALVKPDLRACTRLLSVAAAARRSPLLLLAARRCCWIWMLMEPATAPAPNVASYTGVVDRSSPLTAVPRCALILPLAACCTILRLLLLLATAAARRCRCCLPCCARCCSPCVQQTAAALGACAELCCSLLGFSPHTRGTYLRQGRKMKDSSRSVACAAACLGYFSMCRRLWSHAKSHA
jgi:hypothetical protein